MIKFVLSKSHYFIFIYVAVSFALSYREHVNEVENIKIQEPTFINKIKKKKREIKQLKNYYRDIEQSKQRIEKAAQQNEKLQRQLPAEISDTENLDMISSLAKSLNIKNVFLTPGEEVSKGFYITKNYTFKSSGTFLQMLIFFEKLGDSKRIFNVRGLELVKTDEKQRGRFQLINAIINIETYKYNPNFREDRGIDQIEAEFKTKKRTSRRRRKR